MSPLGWQAVEDAVGERPSEFAGTGGWPAVERNPRSKPPPSYKTPQK